VKIPRLSVRVGSTVYAGSETSWQGSILRSPSTEWRAVEIGPDGWRIIGSPPVRFRRAAGMLPLPEPQAGGSIEVLLTLPPLADDQRRPERQFWCGFELARPRILGSLLDAAAHGLRRLSNVYLQQLPRMADFVLWATACETAFWPAGTFARAYSANRRAAIEDLIDADPVAARVREIMADRSMWTGSASDLLRAGAGLGGDGPSSGRAGWPNNPRALAGRLRRAQTFLRALGIEVTFSREGRAGNRVIRMRATTENTVSTVGSVSEYEPRVRTGSTGRSPRFGRPVGSSASAAYTDADVADGADANFQRNRRLTT